MSTPVTVLSPADCKEISGGLTKHPGIIIVEYIPYIQHYSPTSSNKETT